MLRNLPCKLKPAEVLDALNAAGLEGRYDFMYLPMNRTQKSNMGYCFVNFVTEEDANACRERMEGRPIGPHKSDKLCKISLADVQGKTNLMEHFAQKQVLRHGQMYWH
jgi:RNA recognition motif-containing protein